jgi:hypothetical protein
VAKHSLVRMVTVSRNIISLESRNDYLVTERRGREVNTPASYSGGPDLRHRS